MSYRYKYIFGLIGLVLLLHSFLLNSQLVDLLLDPATDAEAITITPAPDVHLPIAYYNYHNLNTKHPAAPMQHKHHNKHKSAKHAGFKCLLDKYDELAYGKMRLNMDIHTAGQVCYYYRYFREINPPPPKFS